MERKYPPNNHPRIAAINQLNLPDEDRYAAYEDFYEEYNRELRQAKDDGIISPQQQIFIEQMGKGLSQTAAYKVAYPDASDQSAQSSSSRLMYRPSIERAVKQAMEDNRQAQQQRFNAGLQQQIATIRRRRAILDDIIESRKVHRVTVTNNDTGETKTRVKEDPMLIIRAIKLDMLLQETQTTLEASIPPGLSFEDLTPSDSKPVTASTPPQPTTATTKNKIPRKTISIHNKDSNNKTEFRKPGINEMKAGSTAAPKPNRSIPTAAG